RAASEQLAERRCGVEQLLEVVEQEQHPALADRRGEVALHTDHPGDRRLEQERVVDGGERNPEDAAVELRDELGRHLEGEPRLAAAARADERDEPVLARERDELRQLARTAD